MGVVDGTAPNVLVVGRAQDLNPIIRARLQRSDVQPVWQTCDPMVAYEVAAEHRPGYVVLDFGLPQDPDVVADSLRALIPTAWVIDFAGCVRRRPDHAPVSLAHTEPLFVTIH